GEEFRRALEFAIRTGPMSADGKPSEDLQATARVPAISAWPDTSANAQGAASAGEGKGSPGAAKRGQGEGSFHVRAIGAAVVLLVLALVARTLFSGGKSAGPADGKAAKTAAPAPAGASAQTGQPVPASST